MGGNGLHMMGRVQSNRSLQKRRTDGYRKRKESFLTTTNDGRFNSEDFSGTNQKELGQFRRTLTKDLWKRRLRFGSLSLIILSIIIYGLYYFFTSFILPVIHLG